MRVVFMGSPEFALPTLAKLADRGHVVAVVTQPDRPSGRGQRLQPPAVKVAAQQRTIPVLQPERLREPETQAAMRSLAPDLIVVVAYGKLIPREILELPRLGCLNVHASLLPKYRGAAPIQRALLNGETTTGITIMQLDEGLDTGPTLLSEAIPIASEDTAGTLERRLAELGGALLIRALDARSKGELSATPQPVEGVSYAPKIGKEDARLDFSARAQAVRDLVRAMDPNPGPWTTWQGSTLRLFRGRVLARPSPSLPGAAPGTVLASDGHDLVVACGVDAIAFGEIQAAGGRRLPMDAFLRGKKIPAGTVLGP